ncbi:MAG: DUF499 domain-containing protein [Bacteroidota bacterium]
MSTHTPWHQVVTLRDDLLSGTLALNLFAADLYEVAMRSGEQPMYEDPTQFFARTHATHNMRRLVGEVAKRLGGQSDKAVRKLALTYGGGKTHTLITLLHFFGDPDGLPDLPAVRDFRQAVSGPAPHARVATVAFDKLDVEKGMDVLSPTGEQRRLFHPWSLLAYQLAGDDGLRALHADGEPEERETPPTEQYLKEVLQAPAQDGLATLVLFDEVLLYARNKVALDAAWRKRIVDFFQTLTQAVTKTNRTALVVSLLANDLQAADPLGKRLEKELEEIVARQKEEDVQPVEKRDVAQVLRQQFFTPDSIENASAFRSHALGAVAAIAEIDEHTKRHLKSEEERYTANYPFHPELTEVFYTKWTSIEGFHQTRGVLRNYAIALREAARWDTAPLVGPNVFLAAPDAEPLSDAAREVAEVARTATGASGNTIIWPNILEGELQKARGIQSDMGTLKGRELEQAVMAVFLHSQPPPQRATLPDLLALIAHTGPIRIELDKGLQKWASTSWYLDDERLDAWDRAAAALPQEWRLGGQPNLRQMHDYAREKLVKEDAVDVVLQRQLVQRDHFKKGVGAAGAKLHPFPRHPRDIEDDARLHFAPLLPEAACEAGYPSPYAQRFLTSHTSEDKPRVYRNNLLLVAPSNSGLAAARNAIREMLAWEQVKSLSDYAKMPQIRKQQIQDKLRGALDEVGHAVRQAYCIVVTHSETAEVQAFKVTITSDPLFTIVKGDERARVQETVIEPSALLPAPDGHFGIWPEKATDVSAHDLVAGFFRYPRLPKLLTPSVVEDTLVQGCLTGTFALAYTRGDGSVRTYWLEQPDAAALEDKSLKAVLPEHAEIGELSPALLEKGKLPGLWTKEVVTLGDLYAYFAGGHTVMIPVPGTQFEEPVKVPKADPEVIKSAITQAVEQGRLWLIAGRASLWQEEPPASVLTDAAELHEPPAAIPHHDLLPEALPDAWSDGSTSARALYDALRSVRSDQLPWTLVAQAISDAIKARVLEPDGTVIAWPSTFDEADTARFRLSGSSVGYGGASGTASTWREPTPPNVHTAEAELGIEEVQDLADVVAAIQSAAAGHSIRFKLRVELGSGQPIPTDVVEQVRELLTGVSSDLEL